ncbi:MAG: DUF2269 domain-containing protein [Syntrophomonadaceae bacterium]|nr:DUF2269 domain-containing protein [Syntrophomonadaceae bacterium]
MATFLDILSTLVIIAVMIGIMFLISKYKPNKLNIKQRRNWLIAHVIFVIFAISGLLGNLVLTLVSTAIVADQIQIYSAHFLTRYFIWFLIIPGIFGSFITGIWLALRTKWELTKYYWIIVKTLGTITAILFGRTWMPIWLEKITFLSQANPMHNPAYFHSRQMLILGISIALGIMFFLVIISYIKPWGKRSTAQAN